jgi:hypothetical protein
MTTPIELPSGKLLDLDRFIALVPNYSENKAQCELILEGYPKGINLEEKDVFVLKEKLYQTLQIKDNINQEEQLKKNQPLINLMHKWLQEKEEKIATLEDNQEYQEIQTELLKHRIR